MVVQERCVAPERCIVEGGWKPCSVPVLVDCTLCSV